MYSWRLSPDLKTEVERAARTRKKTFSAILETAVREWLEKSGDEAGEEAEQRRLHAEAENCLGIISSGRRGRSERVSADVRARLGRRYGR